MAQDNDMLTAVQNSNRLLAQIAQYMSTVFPQQSTTA